MAASLLCTAILSGSAAAVFAAANAWCTSTSSSLLDPETLDCIARCDNAAVLHALACSDIIFALLSSRLGGATLFKLSLPSNVTVLQWRRRELDCPPLAVLLVNGATVCLCLSPGSLRRGFFDSEVTIACLGPSPSQTTVRTAIRSTLGGVARELSATILGSPGGDPSSLPTLHGAVPAAYARAILLAAVALLPAASRVLLLGVGGGVVASVLSRLRCPCCRSHLCGQGGEPLCDAERGLSVVGIDCDAAATQCGTEWFGLGGGDGTLTLVTADALEWVAGAAAVTTAAGAAQPFSLVIIDLYSDVYGGIPAGLSTPLFWCGLSSLLGTVEGAFAVALVNVPAEEVAAVVGAIGTAAGALSEGGAARGGTRAVVVEELWLAAGGDGVLSSSVFDVRGAAPSTATCRVHGSGDDNVVLRVSWRGCV